MDAEMIKLIAIAFVMGVGTIAPAVAIGLIGSRSAEAIGRTLLDHF